MQPTQNLQMTRVEPCKEDQSVNTVLRSGRMTSTNKCKKHEEDGWVYKTPKEKVRFDLNHTKETFRESNKSLAKDSTSGSSDKMQEISTPAEVDPSILICFWRLA